MTKDEKVIQTKQNEVRFTTSEPKQMIGKFLAERLLRGWTEDFVDEDNGEVVTIERNEVIADRGQLIDAELLSSISFYLQSGDIKEVTVSNQRREGVLEQNAALWPWLASVRVGKKNRKILFYASTIETAFEIVKDFCELNYSGSFWLSSLKEYGSCVMLRDTLKSYAPDDDLEFQVEEDDPLENLKFYQIDVLITSEDGEFQQTFVVETKDTEKAMIIINNYLAQHMDKDNPFESKLETAKVIPCDNFIEKEFSLAYIPER